MLDNVSADVNQPQKGEFQNITALLRTYLGPETLDTQVHVVEGMVVIRVRGILTPAEKILAERRIGRELVKKTREQLFEITRPYIEKVVGEMVRQDPITIYSHLNLETDEQMILALVDAM